MRGWVSERVRWVRHARTMLALLGTRANVAVAALEDISGGGYPGRDVAGPLVELSRAMSELDAFEVVLRDVDRGLIDFPTVRPDGSRAVHECGSEGCPARGTPDGPEVYLCWLIDGEDEIGFWHSLESGFAGRRPLGLG